VSVNGKILWLEPNGNWAETKTGYNGEVLIQNENG